MSNHGGVPGDMLRSFVERYERLVEEKKGIAEEIKYVVSELKSSGFNAKIFKIIIKRRSMDASDRQEMDALVDMYEQAVNFNTTPLGQAAEDLSTAKSDFDEVVQGLSGRGIEMEIITSDSTGNPEVLINEGV